MSAAGPADPITAWKDSRIFPFGEWLRIDENRRIAAAAQRDQGGDGAGRAASGSPGDCPSPLHGSDDLDTLQVLPGLTSPGTLYYYTHCEEMLAGDAAGEIYVRSLLPMKLALDRVYLRNATPVVRSPTDRPHHVDNRCAVVRHPSVSRPARIGGGRAEHEHPSRVRSRRFLACRCLNSKTAKRPTTSSKPAKLRLWWRSTPRRPTDNHRYSLLNASELLWVQERQRAIAKLLVQPRLARCDQGAAPGGGLRQRREPAGVPALWFPA